MISMIAAMSKNRVIGVNGKVPWRISEDSIYFKNKTMGHPVIMGRKTFESGKDKDGNIRPLPGRKNIVVTSNKDLTGKVRKNFEGVTFVDSLDKAIEEAKKQEGSEEIFIVGGAKMYEEGMKIADRIYLTEIDAEVEGDTYFPEMDANRWKLISNQKRVIKFNGFELTYYFNAYNDSNKDLPTVC